MLEGEHIVPRLAEISGKSGCLETVDLSQQRLTGPVLEALSALSTVCSLKLSACKLSGESVDEFHELIAQ